MTQNSKAENSQITWEQRGEAVLQLQTFRKIVYGTKYGRRVCDNGMTIEVSSDAVVVDNWSTQCDERPGRSQFLLVSKTSTQQFTMSSWTRAHKWIVRFGDDTEDFDLSEFKECLDAQSDVDQPTATGCTLAHFAARTIHAKKLLSFLDGQGAQLDLPDSEGIAPLHWAAMNSSRSAVDTLLDFGVEPNPRDKEGNTPFHYAVECGNLQVAKILYKASKDTLNLKNYSGQSALYFACVKEEIDIIMFLLRSGALFEEKVLERAIKQDASKLIRILLSAKEKQPSWSEDRKKGFLTLAKNKHKANAERELLKIFRMSPM